MAALLRQGARRIGVSVLQRTKTPAVAEEGRRLVPRRLHHTHEYSSYQHPAKPFQNEEIPRMIQRKKEELYNVLCKAEQSFWTSSFRNKRLLMRLSVQVKPRPEDTKWQIMRFSKRAVQVVDAAGFIALTCLVCSTVVGFGRFMHDEGVFRDLMEWVKPKKLRQTEN